jgi:hypothetical protein
MSGSTPWLLVAVAGVLLVMAGAALAMPAVLAGQ